MSDYVERAKDVYAALQDADVSDDDVADLTIAVLQEEAKDRRTEMIGGRGQQSRQTRIDEQDQQDTDAEGASDETNWRDDPATEAQKNALERMGVSYDPELTKGEASNLIDQSKAQQAEA